MNEDKLSNVGTTEPTPTPMPGPIPAPMQEPTPAPMQEPTPAPMQEPTPAPMQEPTPAPMPGPTPASMPAAPTPMPAAPTPMPEAPTPMPEVPTEQKNVNDAVSNLNKEEAMEEALSHTNQYSPFEAPKQEVNKEVKKTNNKGAYIFIGIIFAILLLFIIFLPQISKLIGW